MQLGQICHRPLTLYDGSRSRLSIFLPHNMMILRLLPPRSAGRHNPSYQPRSPKCGCRTSAGTTPSTPVIPAFQDLYANIRVGRNQPIEFNPDPGINGVKALHLHMEYA